MFSPDSRANLARRQAEIPLNALCKNPGPPLATFLVDAPSLKDKNDRVIGQVAGLDLTDS
jgi:hypothetical protein